MHRVEDVVLRAEKRLVLVGVVGAVVCGDDEHLRRAPAQLSEHILLLLELALRDHEHGADALAELVRGDRERPHIHQVGYPGRVVDGDSRDAYVRVLHLDVADSSIKKKTAVEKFGIHSEALPGCATITGASPRVTSLGA